MASASDKLFLLEFVVDSVKLDVLPQSITEEDECCVSFRFLNNPVVDICVEDFAPNERNMKGGKSCLFALPPELGDQHINEFPVFTHVQKKVKNGPRVNVGNCKILITSLFSEILKKVNSHPDCVPTSKSMKDKFLLQNIFDEEVGSITVYLRLSCFGKIIVTQFQMGANSSYMFKGHDDTMYCSRNTSQEKQVNQLTSSGDSLHMDVKRTQSPQNEYLKLINSTSHLSSETQHRIVTSIKCRTPTTISRKAINPEELESSGPHFKNQYMLSLCSPSTNSQLALSKEHSFLAGQKSLVCSGTLLQKEQQENLCKNDGEKEDGYSLPVLQMLKENNIVLSKSSSQDQCDEYVSKFWGPNRITVQPIMTNSRDPSTEKVKTNLPKCKSDQSDIEKSKELLPIAPIKSLPNNLPAKIEEIDPYRNMYRSSNRKKNQTIDLQQLMHLGTQRTKVNEEMHSPRLETRETQYMKSDFPPNIDEYRSERPNTKCKSRNKDHRKKVTSKPKKEYGRAVSDTVQCVQKIYGSKESVVSRKLRKARVQKKKNAKFTVSKLLDRRNNHQPGNGDSSGVNAKYEKLQNTENILVNPEHEETIIADKNKNQELQNTKKRIKKDSCEDIHRNSHDDNVSDSTTSVARFDNSEEVDELQHEAWTSGMKVTMKRKPKDVTVPKTELLKKESEDSLIILYKEEKKDTTSEKCSSLRPLSATQLPCLERFQASSRSTIKMRPTPISPDYVNYAAVGIRNAKRYSISREKSN